MVQRKVTYRAELDGGAQVKAEFQGIGKAGRTAYDQIDRGQKTASKSAQVFERALEAEERSFRALKASVDPAYAAQLRFERVQAQVNRQVRLGVVSQKEASMVLQQFEARTRGAAVALETVDRASVGAGNGLRNSLLQINQIGQQVAAGGSLLTATAIQLPDILGGLGGIAPLIAGAVVGLAAGFIPKLMEGRQAAEELSGTLESTYSSAQSLLDAAREAQDRYTTAIRLSGQAQTEVTPQILDALSLEVNARKALARLEVFDLEKKRQAFEASIAQNRAKLDGLVADATAMIVSQPNEQFFNGAAEQARLAAVREVLDGNRELVRTIQRQQAELDVNTALLALNAAATTEIDAAMSAAADESTRFASAIDAADISKHGVQAGLLAQQMGIAADEAARYNRALNDQAGLPGGTPAAGGLSFGLPSADLGLSHPAARLGFGDLDAPRLRQVRPLADAKPTGRGGGGASGAARAQSQLDQEALRIRRATTTALEKYNAEMALANQLLEKGKIDQDVYNRHVAATKEAYDLASQGTRQFQRFTTMGQDAVMNAIMGQKGAFDQLKQSIARAVLEYALYRTVAGAPVKGGIGGFFGAIMKAVPSFDGGGDTGDGPRSGGLDGRGGFLAMMHPKERVIDDYRSGRQGGGQAGGMVPMIAIGEGLQVKWLQAADARAQAQIGGFADMQRQNYGAIQGEFQARGTL